MINSWRSSGNRNILSWYWSSTGLVSKRHFFDDIAADPVDDSDPGALFRQELIENVCYVLTHELS